MSCEKSKTAAPTTHLDFLNFESLQLSLSEILLKGAVTRSVILTP